ncbi:MAG: porin [Motiliproteus sp.]|nr:porin [Motiliproteus sp.]MCW9051185.1 porin [Motiliproteus sp.]
MYKFSGFLALALWFISASVEASQPKGWLYQELFGDQLWEERRVNVSARIQTGILANDNSSENVFPTGFFNLEEGLVLNRAEILIEKPLRANYKPRIGPFPGPTPNAWDWGFLIQGRYGEDFSRTYGFEDEWGINEGEDPVLILPQWFAKIYAPIGEGVTFQIGTWFTNIGNEIGAPVDPPSSFYSHPYAMLYGPSKHFGGLLSTQLPIDRRFGLWGVELGLVQGWNNLQDNNNSKSLISALQWRSSDMRTWIDVESIWGNEQSEGGVTDQRPFVAVSSSGKDLFRQFHSLTISQTLGEQRQWRLILNAVYGDQEGGDVAAGVENPPGFMITEDSQWYGVNLSLLWKYRQDLQLGIRGEWFKDDDGAYFLLPEGEYRSWTANLSWFPQSWLRIRPEIRYDRYKGPGKPFGGSLPNLFNGERKEQL